MHHASYGALAAVVDVGRRSCDGACRRNAAEQRGADVADALGDELRIRAVLVAGHAVRHDAGQQRFDGRQDGDGNSVGEHGADHPEGDGMDVQGRQFAANGIEVADGVDRQMRQFDQESAYQDSDEGRGDLFGDFRPQDEDGEAEHADAQRRRVEGAEVLHNGLHLIHGLDGDGPRRIGKAEEILQLSYEDGDGDACGKTDRDGAGDKADEFSKPQHAHQDEQDARHDGGDHQPFHAGIGDDARHDGSKGRRGACDLHLAAAEGGDEEARDDGGIKALLRTDAGSQRQSDGERQCDNGYDDAGDQI